MPSFKCKDIGIKDGFEVKSESRDEIMKIVAVHARESHDMTEVSPE